MAANNAQIYTYLSKILKKHLPKESSYAITTEYLEKCLKDKVLTISEDNWLEPEFMKSATRYDLYNALCGN